MAGSVLMGITAKAKKLSGYKNKISQTVFTQSSFFNIKLQKEFGGQVLSNYFADVFAFATAYAKLQNLYQKWLHNFSQ